MSGSSTEQLSELLSEHDANNPLKKIEIKIYNVGLRPWPSNFSKRKFLSLEAMRATQLEHTHWKYVIVKCTPTFKNIVIVTYKVVNENSWEDNLSEETDWLELQ